LLGACPAPRPRGCGAAGRPAAATRGLSSSLSSGLRSGGCTLDPWGHMPLLCQRGGPAAWELAGQALDLSALPGGCRAAARLPSSESFNPTGPAADGERTARAVAPTPFAPTKEPKMTEVPAWLEPLVEAVAAALTAHGPAGPLGLRFRQVEGVWDVLAYALPVELVGGAQDGGLAAPGFSLDLRALLASFSRVDALAWDAHGTGPVGAECGPCVSVGGEF